MALGDLVTLKVFILGPTWKSQCGIGFQCISPFVNWRELLAAEFRAAIIPDWRACLGFDVAIREITVTDVVPGTAADVVLTLVPEPHGTGGTFEAPAQLCYVISWRSDGIGRNTRGRNYLSGLPRSFIGGARGWGGTAQTRIQTLVEVMLAQYGPTGFSDLARLVVISRGPHSAPLAVPQAFPITHAEFGGLFGSQRKRLGR